MRKLVIVGSVLAIVLATLACIDDDDGRQACESLASKCLPVGRTARCDRVAINAAANGSEVEDCMQAAPECDAATACYETLQR